MIRSSAPVESVSEPSIERVLEAFSRRLNKLLSLSELFPPHSAGLYQALADKYHTNKTQAHRWCNAEALPGPVVLLEMAKDFMTTVDWLLGEGDELFRAPEERAIPGHAIPVYRLKDPGVTGHIGVDSFACVGTLGIPSSSLLTGRPYAVVTNWSAATDPDFAIGDQLLLNMTVQVLEPGGIYLIRTATTTSVRRVNIDAAAGGIRFERKTPVNNFSTLYPTSEIAFNRDQVFEVESRQPGVLIVGRIEGYIRSLLDAVPTLF